MRPILTQAGDEPLQVEGMSDEHKTARLPQIHVEHYCEYKGRKRCGDRLRRRETHHGMALHGVSDEGV